MHSKARRIYFFYLNVYWSANKQEARRVLTALANKNAAYLDTTQMKQLVRRPRGLVHTIPSGAM